MATYTPGATTWTKERALPTLKKTIGRCAQRVRNHGTGENNRFGQRGELISKVSRGFDHRIGAVRNHDPIRCGLPAFIRDQFPLFRGHIQAVDHHEFFHPHIEPAAGPFQHFRYVRIDKSQFPGYVIVLFIKCSACD